MIQPSLYSIIVLESLCLLILVFNYKYMISDRPFKNKNYFFSFCFLTIFAVFFCYGWDYFGYWRTYNTLQGGIYLWYEDYEDWCYLLMSVLPGNYYVWRLVVWGGAALITVWALKRLHVDSTFALVLFIMMPLIQMFYVSRNTLGLSFLMLAMAYLGGTQKKNLWTFFVVLVLVLVSTRFHKSMPLYILVFLMSVFIPYNRVFVIGSLILFPFLYLGIRYYGSLFLNLDVLEDTATYTAGISYLYREDETGLTTIGVITYIIERIPIAFLLIYGTYQIAFKKLKCEKWQKYFLMYSFILIYISYLFYGQASKFLHPRFWCAAQYPLCFFAAGFLSDKRNSGVMRFFYYTLMMSFLYTVIYKVYSWSNYVV